MSTNWFFVLTGMTLTVLDSEAFTAPLFGHDHKPPLGSIIGKSSTNPHPEVRCPAPVSRDDVLNDYWLDMSRDASGTIGETRFPHPCPSPPTVLSPVGR